MNDQEELTKPSLAEMQAIKLAHKQLEVPKSSLGVFELPCGYLDEAGNLHTDVVVSEIKGKVEDILTDGSLSAHKRINELLTRSVDRLGPYTDRGKISQAVLDLTVGDRVFLMFAIRRKSLGDDYPFKDSCPECGAERLYVVNLAELEIKKGADPKQRAFSVTLPSGKTAQFHPMTGRDEDRLAAEKKERVKGLKGEKARRVESENAMSYGILMRLDTLDGKVPTLEAVQDLGLADRNFLRDQFEANEGGLDTENEFLCPECETEFRRDVDVTQQSFFFPSATRKNSKTKSSS